MTRIERTGTIDQINKNCMEIVERKGLGHPDTLADGAAESASIALSNLYLKKTGIVLHHNLDKLYIKGGSVQTSYGYSRVIAPANLYIGGHVSTTFGGEDLGAYETIESAAETYVRAKLPVMEDSDLKTVLLTNDNERSSYWHHPRSIADIPEATDPRANDTSTSVGSWPVSIAELAALSLEGFFYMGDGTPRFQDVGYDIKVKVRRLSDSFDFTLAIPLLSRHIKSFDDYTDRLNGLEYLLKEYAQQIIGNSGQVALRINPERRNNRNAYLQHYGSCIEAAEEGFVGRGNKGHGVISNRRPLSMEAPHGKNPWSFSGKVHTLMAIEFARKLSERHNGATVDVYISTDIGDPIRDPSWVIVAASTPIDPKVLNEVFSEVRELDYLEMTLAGYFMPKVITFQDNCVLNNNTTHTV